MLGCTSLDSDRDKYHKKEEVYDTRTHQACTVHELILIIGRWSTRSKPLDIEN